MWDGWPANAPKPAIAPFDVAQAKKYQEEWAQYLKVDVEYMNSIRMKFRLIPPGEFLMGSPPAQIEELLKSYQNSKVMQVFMNSETPQVRVVLTKPIYMSVYEVTQKDYQQVIGSNPSYFSQQGAGKNAVVGKNTATLPVEQVSWNDAAGFCAKLSTRERKKPFYSRTGEQVTFKDGDGYRLPTAAEWECACRAGTTTTYWSGDTLEDLQRVAWFGTRAFNGTRPVGEFPANPFGLFDMHGNAYEWCQDYWSANYYTEQRGSLAKDPKGPSTGTLRVYRGGDFYHDSIEARSAWRHAQPPGYTNHPYGFRVVLPVRWTRTDSSVSRSGKTLEINNDKPAVDIQGEVEKQRKAKTSSEPTPAVWNGWPKDAPPPAIAPFSAEQAQQYQQAWAKHLKVDVEIKNSLGMKLRLIPPGEFSMGSERHPNERPVHRVILTQPIHLGIHEVTQAEYQKVMGTNPSYYSRTGAGRDKVVRQNTSNYPVEQVTWQNAVEFCRRLTESERRAKRLPQGAEYRLPTEAEWEFASRSGSETTFWFGEREEELPRAAWFNQNAAGQTHPVGKLTANPFGLFDVHGNVCEWCADWSVNYPTDDLPFKDPRGPSEGIHRAYRGGYWDASAKACSLTDRGRSSPSMIDRANGFRIALSSKPSG